MRADSLGGRPLRHGRSCRASIITVWQRANAQALHDLENGATRYDAGISRAPMGAYGFGLNTTARPIRARF